MKKVFEEEKIVSNINKELDEIKRLTNSNKEVTKKILNIERELKKL